MRFRLLKGYVLMTLAAVVLAAAAILLVMNLDNDWRLKVYWRDRTLPRAAWLLLAAGGGLVVWWTLRKLLPAGVASVREGAAARRSREVERRTKELERRERQARAKQPGAAPEK